MKRVLSVILLVGVICLCFASCGGELQSLSGNTEITYKIENGEARVVRVPNKSVVTSVAIPDEYDGVPVTAIEKFAAVNLEYVTEISIGKNVKEISDWAFGNSKKITRFDVDDENEYICDVDGVIYTKDMKSILFYPPARAAVAEKDAQGNDVKSISYVIPEGVETIRTKAFYKCEALKEISLPSTLRHIEEKAFFRCDLQEIDLPDGLETIGKDAFFDCTAVQEITVPSSVTAIDEYAFFNCVNLKVVNMQCKESEVTVGKKWYPTKNGGEIDGGLTINWQ